MSTNAEEHHHAHERRQGPKGDWYLSPMDVETEDGLVRGDVAAQRCGISANLVRRFARARSISYERRIIYDPEKKKTKRMYFVSMRELREYLRQRVAERGKAKTIADPISVARAAELCGVAKGTINSWIVEGKIAPEVLGHPDRGGRRFVVSLSAVVEFARQTLPSGDGEEWLYRFQIPIQFPNLSVRTAEHYSIRKKPRAYNVPTLGKPVDTRRVDRPAGLKCPHERVHQWRREHLAVLDGWVRTRGDFPAAPYPTVQQAIDFLQNYLIDGKPHPLQDIIAAAAGQGIKRQPIIAAVPFLKGLVREREPKGKLRFSTWRLPRPNGGTDGGVMTGAASTNGRKAGLETVDDREPLPQQPYPVYIVQPANQPVPVQCVSSESKNIPPVSRAPVVLGAQWQDPVVLRGSIVKQFGSYFEWKLVKALRDAGPDGLNKDGIEAVTSSARRILRDLCKGEDWSEVIAMAKDKGGPYSLKW